MRLRYTSLALADLDAILDHIRQHSPQAARHVQDRIRKAIRLLPLYPRIGAPTDDPIIRRLTTGPYPYLIFYEATRHEIIVHAVRHAARDPAGTPGAR